jgi:hypothetical protein
LLLIFAGAVQRVDDPHPAGCEPGKVVGAFLGQDRVAGPKHLEARHQEGVGCLIADQADGPTIERSVAQGHQQLAGTPRQPRRQLMIVHRQYRLPIEGAV